MLVLKGELSSHVWLVPCKFADGEETAATLKRYFLAYRIVPTWVSDQDRHFVNKLVKILLASFAAYTLSPQPTHHGLIVQSK